MAVPSAAPTPRSPRPDSSAAAPSLDFGDPASLAALPGLTDAGAVTRLLHECVAYQRALHARLGALLARRPDLDRAAASLLRSAPPLLSLAASDATVLRKSSSSTAVLAEALSSRVRDAAHSRAESALARVEAALDRSRMLDTARRALAASGLAAAESALARAEAALDRSRMLDTARRALAASGLAAAATAAHEFLASDAGFPTNDNLRRDLLDIKRRLES